MSENQDNMLQDVSNCANISVDGVPNHMEADMAKTKAKAKTKKTATKTVIGGPKPNKYRDSLTVFPDEPGVLDRAVCDFILLCLYRAAGKQIDYEDLVSIVEAIDPAEMPQLQLLQDALDMSPPRLRRFIRKLDTDGDFSRFCKMETAAVKARKKAAELSKEQFKRRKAKVKAKTKAKASTRRKA